MTEEQANGIARVIGGHAWNSGGNIWLVRRQNSQGKVVVISDEAVCEYENDDAFDEGNEATTSILLA